VSQLTFSKSIL